ASPVPPPPPSTSLPYTSLFRSSIVYSYVYVHAQSVLFAPGVVFVTVTVRSTSQLSVYSASTSSSRLLGSKSPSHRFWLIRSRLRSEARASEIQSREKLVSRPLL